MQALQERAHKIAENGKAQQADEWAEDDEIVGRLVSATTSSEFSVERVPGEPGGLADSERCGGPAHICVPRCYVSTGRQPDLGGALSDCHLLSCTGVSPRVFSQCLVRDGTLQHVYRETATLQPVRSCKQSHRDEQGLAKSTSGIASAWDTR